MLAAAGLVVVPAVLAWHRGQPAGLRGPLAVPGAPSPPPETARPLLDWSGDAVGATVLSVGMGAAGLLLLALAGLLSLLVVVHGAASPAGRSPSSGE